MLAFRAAQDTEVIKQLTALQNAAKDLTKASELQLGRRRDDGGSLHLIAF